MDKQKTFDTFIKYNFIVVFISLVISFISIVFNNSDLYILFMKFTLITFIPLMIVFILGKLGILIEVTGDKKCVE